MPYILLSLLSLALIFFLASLSFCWFPLSPHLGDMLFGELLSCSTFWSDHLSPSSCPFPFEEISALEAQWIAKPAMLRHLALQPPQWTRPQLAQACGPWVSFVKKWLKRFGETDPNDLHVLFSRSRARHTPPPPPDLPLVQRIIEIRTTPPENLQRTPGPRTILSSLKGDAHLAAQGIAPPRSTRTIWKLLRKLGLILDPAERTHKPLEPCEPMQEVHLDFKDATTVPPDP